MGAFDEKNRSQKSRASVPLNGTCLLRSVGELKFSEFLLLDSHWYPIFGARYLKGRSHKIRVAFMTSRYNYSVKTCLKLKKIVEIFVLHCTLTKRIFKFKKYIFHNIENILQSKNEKRLF